MPELVIPDPDFTGDDTDEDETPDFNGSKQCHLYHMAPVDFKEGSSNLSEEAKALLDENVEAMGLMPECCVMITGRAGGKDEASARLLAVERARTVRTYYVSKGISESRLSHQGEWESEKCRAKGDASGDACLLRNTAVTESASCITDSEENNRRPFRIRRLWNFLLIS